MIAIICREKEVALLARSLGIAVAGVMDRDPNAGWEGVPWLGDDSHWAAVKQRHPGIRVVCGLDITSLKARLIPACYALEDLASLVSASAFVGPGVEIGMGSVVQQGVTLTTDIRLGVVCKINLGASIHHDCVVGDYCTIAPGARLLGAVTLEDRVFVGAGAVILPHRRIGAGAIIGAGAVVTEDVAPGTTVVGVPARPIRVCQT